MPNWCFNTLHLKGPEAEIKRFVTANMSRPIRWPAIITPSGNELSPTTPDGPAYFSFNALCPCPQEVILRGYDTHRSGTPVDGIHWCRNNWGTKWDAYHLHITPEMMGYHKGCQELKFSFETANSAPSGWIISMVQEFPRLSIHYEYALPDSLIGRTFEFQDGSVRHFEEWDDARKQAEFGYEEEYWIQL